MAGSVENVYAQALLEIGREDGNLKELHEEIQALSGIFDENRDFAIDKGIEVVPTIFIYRNGKKAKELEGYKTAEELKQEIQNI